MSVRWKVSVIRTSFSLLILIFAVIFVDCGRPFEGCVVSSGCFLYFAATYLWVHECVSVCACVLVCVCVCVCARARALACARARPFMNFEPSTNFSETLYPRGCLVYVCPFVTIEPV
jgi:hypothetical protein